VTLLRTCSYSADSLLFLSDANLIPHSISKLIHCPSLPACNKCRVLHSDHRFNALRCSIPLLWSEIFNYTFPLLTVHVLVFEFYPSTPRHCPDQFCLLRLYCIFTWNLPVPWCSSRKSLCACQSCFVVLNDRSACRDLIITSSTVVHSGRFATVFTSCGVVLKSL